MSYFHVDNVNITGKLNQLTIRMDVHNLERFLSHFQSGTPVHIFCGSLVYTLHEGVLDSVCHNITRTEANVFIALRKLTIQPAQVSPC